MSRSDETTGQRALRRYGPLAGIVLVLALVALLVARSNQATGPSGDVAASNVGASGGTAAGGPRRAISWDEAQKDHLSVTFGAGCDQTRGRIAIPSVFAPPCFAQRPGDNGGATATGVTGDTVKVVVYQPPENDVLLKAIFSAIGFTDTPDDLMKTYEGYTEIFNRFYEMYGRTVQLVPFQGTATSLDSVAARADADKIADDIKPFAVLGGPLLAAGFSEELASRKVININIASFLGAQFAADHAPYLWDILAAPDQTSQVLAEYMGKRLKDKPAKWAGDPELQKQTRKFGLIYLAIPGADVDTLRHIFEQQLKDAGIELAVQVGATDPTQSQAQQIARLKAEGVTTVLFSGDPLSPKNFSEEATRQGYFPEWLVTGSALTDSTVFARTYDQRQWTHAFGISQLFARGRPSANWAYYLYNWYFGEEPPAVNGAQIVFPLPNVLFAGLTAAGPNLTPDTFGAGLTNGPTVGGGLTVPLTSYGQKGYWPVADYYGIDDTVEIWYDPNATGPDERGGDGKGMYRYVDGGKRYLPGKWPSGDPKAFVDEPSAVALYETFPKEDQPPDYPRPSR